MTDKQMEARLGCPVRPLKLVWLSDGSWWRPGEDGWEQFAQEQGFDSPEGAGEEVAAP